MAGTFEAIITGHIGVCLCALRGGVGVKVQGCQIKMSLSIPAKCCTKSKDNHWVIGLIVSAIDHLPFAA